MTSSDRRALRIGATVVAVAVLVLRVVPALKAKVEETRLAWETDAALLRVRQQDLAQAPSIARLVRLRRAQFDSLGSRLLQSHGEATAGSELIQRVSAVARDNGVKVQRAEAAPDSAAVGGLRGAAARFTLESDTEGMLDLLAALQEDGVAMRVKSLRVNAPDPRSPRERAERLDVQMLVGAWYSAESPGR